MRGRGAEGGGMRNWKAVGSEVKSMCHSMLRRIRVPGAVLSYVRQGWRVRRGRMTKERERVRSPLNNGVGVAGVAAQSRAGHWKDELRAGHWKDVFVAWNCSCPHV